MASVTLRPLLACLVGSLVLLATSPAIAQPTGGTTGTTLATSDFSIYFETCDKDQQHCVQMNATDQKYYFNRARCECGASQMVRIVVRPAAGASTKIQTLLAANTVSGGQLRLYIGSVNCLNATSTERTSNCTNMLDPLTYDYSIPMSVFTTGNVFRSDPIPVSRFFGALAKCGPGKTDCDSPSNCQAANSTALYLWLNTTSNLDSPELTTMSMSVDLDGKAPVAPFELIPTGGSDALTVSWTPGVTPAADPGFNGYAVFCVRGADLKVFKKGDFSAPFKTSRDLCEETAPASVSYGAFNNLDPDYLCSDLLTATTNSYRIHKLQNGITYGVGVAAIDKSGNISPISEVVYGQPIPTVDFYTQYRNNGGDAQGGFCAVARSNGGPGMLALAGLAVLGLALRRRRGRRPGATKTLLVLVGGTLAAGQVQAQPSYRDDMAVQNTEPKAWRGTPRQYAIEARFGLYTPAVDSEFSGKDAPQPQTFMFGTKRRPMWQLEFDWQLFQAFGTASVGGVIGYYKENAQSCIRATLTETECERSGDNTSLRLIPLAVLAVYRFDVLAERWRIPLVPYGKLGLNYTIWTVNDGNGNVPKTEGGGRGQGGTAGWQAAVGISLQLDFFDPSAARGFDADAGVNHTYAFFELTHIDSSGLGSKNKLHVGDSTWFAGLMFEF